MFRRSARYLLSALGLAVFLLAIWVLQGEVHHLHWQAVRSGLAAIPVEQLLWAAFLTAASYLVLTGYDLMGMRYIHQALPTLRVMFASFLSYAFSNNIGLSLIGASAVRMRLYTAWGISAGDVVKLVAFASLSFWLGILTLTGVSFLIFQVQLPESWPVTPLQARILAAALLTPVLAYLIACTFRRRPVRVAGWQFELPRPWLAALQILVGTVDWLLAATVLFLLLPQPVGISLPVFVTAYLIAQTAGQISHVPGGLGVFETAMLVLTRGAIAPEILLSAMLLYRLIYYLAPLAVAATLLAGYEGLVHRRRFAYLGQFLNRWVGPIIPSVLALVTFVSGTVLLFSGATPPISGRLALLAQLFPLSVIEFSHFLGSTVGALLLVLALGLQRRSSAAYWTTLGLLGAGGALSLLKGGDYEEALVLAGLLAVLVPCRRHFYRRSALLEERFSPPWVLAILCVIVASVWIGFFTHRHIDYTSDQWWTFGIRADSARFLRASAGAMVVLLVIGVLRLLRTASPVLTAPSNREIAQAVEIVRSHPSSCAYLALLGDKHFHFSASRNAFIMYAVQGSSWIAMGDPVGPEETWPEMLWSFAEQAERYGDRAVFYQVGTEHLSLYIDMGLTLLKLGEEARIPLHSFSLDGGHQKHFRRILRYAEQTGRTFEVLDPGAIDGVLPKMKVVSDEWMREKKRTEKGFSLGFFDARYLRQTPLAIVRQDGRLLAFANIWLSGRQEEISVDLMRYRTDESRDLMDFLLVNVILHGKNLGYRWFNLGMAPLSGMETRTLASVWHKAARQVFRYGRHFYNFQGLRHFKEKYRPVWTPKYLACRGGIQLPAVLADLLALISKRPPEASPTGDLRDSTHQP